MLGPVPEMHLSSLFAGADLFVFPSRHEGFGIPVLEAMAQRTAVVCGDIPALREVAGDAARFVGPDDVDGWAQALTELLTDEREREALVAADARTRRGIRGIAARPRPRRSIARSSSSSASRR